MFTFHGNDVLVSKFVEVLVRPWVEPKYLIGAYVVVQTVAEQLRQLGFGLPVTIGPETFFR